MTRRRLTPEEIDLWRQVVDKAERLHPEKFTAQRIHPKPKPAKTPRAHIERFEIGQTARPPNPRHNLKPGLHEKFAAAPVQMDTKAFGRMKRGKISPEARIDLHGMTLDRAHPALNRFILLAQASGKRLVLVITGKGRTASDHGPIPSPRGILKHQVPSWLSMPPLSQAVLQVSPAHLSHGGSGAYYVYLRKSK